MVDIKLRLCPCCGAQPVVLVAPAGREGEAVRVECSDCRMSTPVIRFGGIRSTYNRRTRAVESVQLLSLDQARAEAAMIWNRRPSA